MFKLWLFLWFFPISPFAFYKLNKENLSNKNHLSILKKSCYVKFILDAIIYITIFSVYFVVKGLDGIVALITVAMFLVYIPSLRFIFHLKEYIKNKEKTILGVRDAIDNIQEYLDVEEYLDTGEIFKFEYKGEKDSYYRKREIVVERIYYKNGIKYIKGYDLESATVKSFREDRMLSSF